MRAFAALMLVLTAWYCTERTIRDACHGDERCITASL